jgi:predicted transcriptional regulator
MTRELPPKLELICLRALWQLGEANVRQVKAVLATERPLAYTTVMTVLDRLTRRGCAQRRKCGRSFIYSPIWTRDSVIKLAVDDLIDVHFEGSAASLQDYLSSRVPAFHIGEEHPVLR